MSLLDLPGPTFLGLYGGLLAGVLVLRRIVGAIARRPASAFPSSRRLEPYEVVWLTGDRRGVVGAAILALQKAGLLNYAKGTVTPFPGSKASRAALNSRPQLEQALYKAVVQRGSLTELECESEFRSILSQLEQGLIRDGFAVSRAWQAATVWFGRYAPLALVVFGALKMMIGLNRGRPIGFLGVLLVGTMVALVVFWQPVRLTNEGEVYLKIERYRNDALRLTASSNDSSLTTNEAILAYGLFGTVPVSLGLSSLYVPRYSPPRVATDGGGGSWSSCSSSSCSSGSSCGGGCGGCGS